MRKLLCVVLFCVASMPVAASAQALTIAQLRLAQLDPYDPTHTVVQASNPLNPPRFCQDTDLFSLFIDFNRSTGAQRVSVEVQGPQTLQTYTVTAPTNGLVFGFVVPAVYDLPTLFAARVTLRNAGGVVLARRWAYWFARFPNIAGECRNGMYPTP